MAMVFLRAMFLLAIAFFAVPCHSAEWRWAGKVAVITGASSGIGAETAVELADRGMVVVGMARRDNNIKALSKRTNGTIHAIKCELTDEEDVIKAFKYIETTFGGVDVLINNAGSFLYSSLITGKTSEWKVNLDVNVLALTVCTREALKTMRKRGDDGHIINLNSAAGHQVIADGQSPTGLYSASKFAVTAITESVRLELAYLKSKIRTTGFQSHVPRNTVFAASVSPGLVNTQPMANYTTPNNETPTYYPSIQPEDVTEAIIYALSTRPLVEVHEIGIQAIGHSFCPK